MKKLEKYDYSLRQLRVNVYDYCGLSIFKEDNDIDQIILEFLDTIDNLSSLSRLFKRIIKKEESESIAFESTVKSFARSMGYSIFTSSIIGNFTMHGPRHVVGNYYRSTDTELLNKKAKNQGEMWNIFLNSAEKNLHYLGITQEHIDNYFRPKIFNYEEVNSRDI